MFAVLGANGHLGRRLLPALLRQSPVRALVRSEAAATQIRSLALGDGCEVRIVDPSDRSALGEALDGCAALAHLAGILKETARNRYQDAHEAVCAAIADAAATAGVGRVVCLGILGSTAGSANACFASRAAAEQLLMDGPVPATIIRVPMVLGESDYAAGALARRARSGLNLVLRGASLEQPIYAGDVIDALVSSLDDRSTADHVYQLAGPESLPRSALIHRAAAVLGRSTRVVSVPLALGMAAAWLLERLSANPPVTRAMLGVLDHDDRVNTEPAASALRIRLTPLDETLRRTLR